MKKPAFKIAAVVILILLAFEAYMELNYSTTTIKEVSISEEKILEEMPDIAVSEEDIALRQFVLSLPEVTALLETPTGELGSTIPNQEAETLLAGKLPQGTEIRELYITGQIVYLTLWEGEAKSIYYTFPADNEQPMSKLIGVYEAEENASPTVLAIYENRNGELTKQRPGRIWFSWLTSLFDNEEGANGNAA